MAKSSTFSADPTALKHTTLLIEELHKYARQIGEDFHTSTADTSWTGYDKFGRELLDKYLRNRESTQRAIDAIGDGLKAVSDGVLSNLREVLATQHSVLDAINTQSTSYRS